MQNWPTNTVQDFSSTGRTASTSASSKMRCGVLPPSSKPTRLKCLAAACAMARPVALLPVKLIVGTFGESTSSFAPSAPLSAKLLTMPLGISLTDPMISAASAAERAAR